MVLFRIFLLVVGLISTCAYSVEQNFDKQSESKVSDDEGKFIIMHYIADNLRTEGDYTKARAAYLTLLENPYISTYKRRDNGLAYAKLMFIIGALFLQEDRNSEKGRQYWEEAAFYGSPEVLVSCALDYYYGSHDTDRAIHLLERALACNHEHYKLSALERNVAIETLIKSYEKVGDHESVQKLKNKLKDL